MISTNLAQAKATALPHDHHTSINSSKNPNSEVLGKNSRKRRRKEQSTERTQKQTKCIDAKEEPI